MLRTSKILKKLLSKKSVQFTNPTMAESFGEKLDIKIADKYMNPMGFLKENEFKNYEGIEEKKNTNKQEKIEKPSKKEMQKEYGFRVKGPEPTRYGDWERNGKCVDF